MTISDDQGTLHVPARDIPIPTSISPEAQAVLAMGSLAPGDQQRPALDDVEGWRAYVEATDTFVLSLVGGRLQAFTGTIDERTIDSTRGGCPVYVVTPVGIADDDRRIYLDIHGGAWVLGGGASCRGTGVTAATQTGARTWAVDYRMPPDHPYPTPLDDCVAAYRTLLDEREPHEIVVGGASAGGNLVAAMLLRARDEGLPMPAGLVINTGAFDLTASSDSWQTNQGLDNLLSNQESACMELYAGGVDRRDPHLSPVYGDLAGLPDTILLTGTRDLLLSDNVRMHRALRAAGVDAQLHVWEAAAHGGFLGMAPEDEDRVGELRRFVDRQWSRAADVARGT